MKPITNRDELDQAMAKLVEIDANKAKIDADLNQELADVRDSFADEYLMPWETGAVHVDQVRAEVEAEIMAYCEANRTTLLTGKAKSVKLTHGVIGWRNGSSAKIEEVKFSEKKQAESTLSKCLAAVMATIKALALVVGKCGLTQLINVEVSWNKPAILKAYNAKELTKGDMKAHGLKYIPATEKFYCDPKSEKVDAKTHSTA